MDAHSSESERNWDVTARLREAIIRGDFMPNERLIESDLAAAFDANRANIRMALAMLDQEGLVVRERHRGARVRLVSDEEAIEIAETRRAIEAMVARQAALKANDADRTSLRAILADMRTACEASDFVAVSQLNATLHREIQRIAAHATADRLLRTLKSQIVRLQYRAIFFPGRSAESLAEHVEIVDAICAGDVDAAAAAMDRHLDRVVGALKQAIAAAKSGGF